MLKEETYVRIIDANQKQSIETADNIIPMNQFRDVLNLLNSDNTKKRIQLLFFE